MAKKTKKGYLWIFDQQDKWDEIASDKITQLDQMKANHLDWFDKHTTVRYVILRNIMYITILKYSISELLALRRPNLKRKRESISSSQVITTGNSQIVPDAIIEEEFNVENQSEDILIMTENTIKDVSNPQKNKTEDILKSAENQVVKAADKSKGQVRKEANATENLAENVNRKYSVIIPPSTIKPIANVKSQPIAAKLTVQNKPLERQSIRTIRDDYDAQDDQVQVVVSARQYNTEPKEKVPVSSPVKEPKEKIPVNLPVKETLQPSSSSLKTFSLSHSKASPSNTTRHRSAFMNRLFKTTRPSLKKAALPSASTSTSTTSSAKRDSHSNHPVIITKRPSSTSSVKSFKSAASSTPIQMSDMVPEPRFKRPKILQQSTPSQTHQLSMVEEADEKSQSQNQNQNQNSEDDCDEEASFKIPIWAVDPGLDQEFMNQSQQDADRIFGSLPRVDLRGK